MTPGKAEMEAREPKTVKVEVRSRFQPIKPRGGSPTAASDEVIRGRGRNPNYYENEPMPESDGVNPLQIQQCCVVLEQVEKTGKKPITLEWFRDYALLHSHRFDWLGTPESRQRVIDKAVEVGAIKLHATSDTLGSESLATALSLVKFEPPRNGKRYNPIIVRGEPVSETLIRDRGGY